MATIIAAQVRLFSVMQISFYGSKTSTDRPKTSYCQVTQHMDLT